MYAYPVLSPDRTRIPAPRVIPNAALLNFPSGYPVLDVDVGEITAPGQGPAQDPGQDGRVDGLGRVPGGRRFQDTAHEGRRRDKDGPALETKFKELPAGQVFFQDRILYCHS